MRISRQTLMLLADSGDRCAEAMAETLRIFGGQAMTEDGYFWHIVREE